MFLIFLDMNENASILVCCHNKDYRRNDEGFLPIQVGKAISNVNLGIVGDDTGDNISSLNPNFCELTALYWLWKNGEKKKYVGLNHYRRYFDFTKKHTYGDSCNFISLDDIKKKKNILPSVEEIFDNYDIIMPTAIKFPYNLRTDYSLSHINEDYKILKTVIEDLKPDYLSSFIEVMEKGRSLRAFNMFITKWEIFDEYAQWLFDILFEVKKRIQLSPYPYQARIFGFMSERLLNVYVYHHNLKIKKVPVMMISDQSNHSVIRKQLKWMRNFFISKLFKIS